jgi:hypothetical protein
MYCNGDIITPLLQLLMQEILFVYYVYARAYIEGCYEYTVRLS